MGEVWTITYLKSSIDSERQKVGACAFKILAQQVVKGMNRTMPVQHVPRAIVEPRLHAFELAPRHTLELGAGGKERRSKPFVVSFVLRSQGHWGWAT